MTELERTSPFLHQDVDLAAKANPPELNGPLYHNTEQAIAAFDRETQNELRPDAVAAFTAQQLGSAILLVEHQELELAKNLLRNVLNYDPYCVEAIRWLGHCFREQKSWDEAEKCFLQWARLWPCEGAYFALAEVQYLQGRDEKALSHYLEALRHVQRESPALFEIYKNIGNIYVRAGDFEAAEENYNKAYTLNPRSDVLMVNYGTLEIQRENYDEAVYRFRTAVQYNSQNDRAWVGLALVHRQRGDVNLSWANLECALDIRADNETALRLAIDWAIQDYRLDQAISRMRAYVDSNGSDASLVLWLAHLLMMAGILDEALFEVERALALDPKLEGAEALAMEIEKAHQHKRGLP